MSFASNALVLSKHFEKYLAESTKFRGFGGILSLASQLLT